MVVRLRSLAVILVALLAGASLLWSVLGVLNARDTLSGLQATGAESNSELDTGSRIDLVAVQLSEAKEALSSLRWWTAPLRATSALWSWLPWWGGDVGQMDALLDYAETVLRSADVVVTTAYSAAYLEPGWTVTNLRRTASALTWHEDALLSAADTLRVAEDLRRRGIEEERLSATMRERLRVVDGLRRELEAAIEVALAAPPLLDSLAALMETAERLYDGVQQRDRLSAVLAIDDLGPELTAIESTFAELSLDWHRIVPALNRMSEHLPIAMADLQGSFAQGERAIEELLSLHEALQQSREVLGRGFAKNAADSRRMEAGLRAVASSAEALSTTLGEYSPVTAVFPGLDRAPELLIDLESFALLLLKALGFQGLQVHVVLAQDDEEVRPSGGFLGALWELTLLRGRLVEQRFLSSYTVDEDVELDDWVKAPESFSLGMGAFIVPFRDQNWWVHFPTSADTLRETYRRGQGRRPDTIAALNQAALELLLGATGPIVLGPEGGETVDAESVRQLLREGHPVPNQSGFPADWDEQRYAVYLLGLSFLSLLQSADPDRVAGLLEGVTQAVQSGDIVVSAPDDAGKAFLGRLGWDGSLPTFGEDGFYWVDSNVYGPKTSHRILRSFKYRAEVSADGDVRGELTVRYENPVGSASDYCYQPAADPHPPCYWLYFRLYLPERASVTAVPRLPLPETSIAATFRTPFADTVRVAEGADGFPAPAVEVSGLSVVEAAGVSEWRFAYEIPNAATVRDGIWTYLLRIPKQPGVQGAVVEVELRLPAGACVVGARPDHLAGPLHLRFALTIDQDLEIEVDYATDPEACANARRTSAQAS